MISVKVIHSVFKSWEQGGSACQYNVGIQVLPNVSVTKHNGAIKHLVDTRGCHIKKGRLEKCLSHEVPFMANGDGCTVWSKELFCNAGFLLCHFILQVKGNISKFFLDLLDKLIVFL